MSDKSTAEMEERKKPSDATTETLVAAERQRIIDRVLTYAALRDQAAVMLDKAASSPGPEKPSEGAAERARAQAEVARDIARYLAEEANSSAERLRRAPHLCPNFIRDARAGGCSAGKPPSNLGFRLIRERGETLRRLG